MSTVLDPIDPSTEAQLASKPAAGQGEQPTPDAPAIPEFANVPEDVSSSLLSLIRQYELESDAIRRHHVKKYLKAEQFWVGRHYSVWDEEKYRWHTPFEYAIENGKLEDLPIYQYVTNVYQAYGMAIIAALSQKLPKVRFHPKSAESERDIATAKAASDISELIEKNNRLERIVEREAYLLWTQGLFGAYVRYVVDSEYGEKDEPVVEMTEQEISPDRLLCQNCGTESPMPSSLMPQSNGTCPTCANPLTDMDFRPAERATLPVVTGYQKVPEGLEKISIYGAMNLKMMPWAKELSESGYLILCEEQHEASLRAAYPYKRDKIVAKGTTDAGDTYEKAARSQLVGGSAKGQANQATLTYKRAWLRPWAFYGLQDKDQCDKLLSLFPSGCYVAFAGNEFLEAREEKLDDHWRICRAIPGQGMYTEAIGDSTIPINERINDSHNIQAEHVEFGSAPPVLFDARYISGQALKSRKMRPASYVPVSVEGASGVKSLSDMIYQPRITLDANIYSYGKDLIELVQLISGAFPAIFGGTMQGVETASGYRMARDQAMGRLNLFWKAMKNFHADLSLISVNCFKDNRTQDVEQVVTGKGGDYASKYIHLEDLQGSITAEPEADEDFPASWAEVRQNILEMMKNLPPELAAPFLQALTHPSNAALMRRIIADPDIQFPAEANREKQYREIDNLLQSAPMPGAPQLDPMSGQPVPGPMQSTVPVDVWFDDHTAQMLTIQEWAVSDAGIEAKQMNPAGYANIVAHYQEHEQAQVMVAQHQAQLQMAAMPPQPPGSEQQGPPKEQPKQ